MKIKPLEDGNSRFDLVELRDDGNIGRLTPHCKVHGAMLKVSRFKGGGGFWRCIQAEYRGNKIDSRSGKCMNDCRAGCIEEDEI